VPADGVTTESRQIRVSDSVRSYLLIRVGGTDPATVPTIVDLHGSGSWPEEQVAVTRARACAAAGAVVVVPQAGIPFRLLVEWPAGWAWNVPGSALPGESVPRGEPDDVAFLDELVTHLVTQHGVDPHRVHLRGFSGGARLASHLMATMSDRLASVTCVGGVRFVEPHPGGLPPLLAIHGDLDTLNPYRGNAGPRWSGSVESAVRQWAVASGCAPRPQCRTMSDGVRETRYVDTSGFAAVRLVTVADAAHAWPGTGHADHIAQFGVAGNYDASQAHCDFVGEVDVTTSRGAAAAGDDRQRPTLDGFTT
jgi:polyhydroxybutyrate depolymerase